MYRLLIVDDEELIVNSLYEMFTAMDPTRLDVYKAYSGEEALNWLRRTRIDIVISDINMPEMDGLMLLDEIHARWPWCKVIFLTGYDRFEYIYNALKVTDVSYILKSEDPDQVIQAVEEAILAIDQSNQTHDYLQEAKEQMEKANLLLKRDYLMGILRGENRYKLEQKLLDEMAISLFENAPVLYAIGQPLKPLSDKDFLEVTEHFLSIKKMIEQKLWIQCHNIVLLDGDNNFHLLIQPRALDQDNKDRNLQHHYEALVLYVKGTLEQIQLTCLESLKTPLRFIISSQSCEWEGLPDLYNQLFELSEELAMDKDCAVLTTKDYEQNGQHESSEVLWTLDDETPNEIRTITDYEWLETLINAGEREAFNQELDKATGLLLTCQSKHDPKAMGIYFNCATRLLNYINRKGLYEKMAFRIGQGQLLNIDAHSGWIEARTYLYDISHTIFDLRHENVLNKEEKLIQKIQSFIRNNLGGDLSLVRLSEQIYMSPSYLSRFL